MNTFHTILQRVLIAFFATCFAFTLIYVPQSWNKIERVEAGGLDGDATEWTQLRNEAELITTAISSFASKAYNLTTSIMSTYLKVKESTLDGIAWMLAKQILSQLTASIVKWINSGFQGSPTFVQDLEGFLLRAADIALGDYLFHLGGPLSFVCAPFKIDVMLAVSVHYQNNRNGYPVCTLSGALKNIENFISGDFISGGWNAWYTMTNSPNQYTPYGSTLTAQGELGIRITSGQNAQSQYLTYGSGFLSNKVCEAVHGEGTKRENCFITTPGKAIQESLTFHLSTGSRSLIAADEIDEIVNALLAQLAKQAIAGTAGLLGLTKGTGRTDRTYAGASPDGSYIDDMVGSGGVNPEELYGMIEEALAIEEEYRDAAEEYRPKLQAYASSGKYPSRKIMAKEAANDIVPLLEHIDENITDLEALIYQLETNPNLISEIGQEFMNLELHTADEIESDIENWKHILSDPTAETGTSTAVTGDYWLTTMTKSLETEKYYLKSAEEYKILLQNYSKDTSKSTDSRNKAEAKATEIANLIVTLAPLVNDLTNLTQKYIAELEKNSFSTQEKTKIVSEYNLLTLHDPNKVEGDIRSWQELLK